MKLGNLNRDMYETTKVYNKLGNQQNFETIDLAETKEQEKQGTMRTQYLDTRGTIRTSSERET